MAKSGRLSASDKYTIVGAMQDGKSPQEIATMIGKSVAAVEKHIKAQNIPINKEVKSNRFRVRDEDVQQVQEVETFDEYATPKIRGEVKKMLVDGGVTEQDASKLISKVLEQAADVDKKFTKPFDLYKACIKKMRAGNFMNKKTAGGKGGVSVMTPAASERIDDARKGVRRQNLNENIHRIR